MRNPLKQGLKQSPTLHLTPFLDVAMRNPLKQGLKQLFYQFAHIRRQVAMRNPLKQGLKPMTGTLTLHGVLSRNAKSTKTRIETHIYYLFVYFYHVAMRNPLKQGLKLLYTLTVH